MAFLLFNATDEIMASERVFDTEAEALEAMAKWKRDRMGRPYLTFNGYRIEAQQVVLKVIPAADE